MPVQEKPERMFAGVTEIGQALLTILGMSYIVMVLPGVATNDHKHLLTKTIISVIKLN